MHQNRGYRFTGRVCNKKMNPSCTVPLTFAVRLKHLTVLGGNLGMVYKSLTSILFKIAFTQNISIVGVKN